MSDNLVGNGGFPWKNSCLNSDWLKTFQELEFVGATYFVMSLLFDKTIFP